MVVSLESVSYPRTYRLTVGWKVLLLSGGIVFAVVAFFAMGSLVRANPAPHVSWLLVAAIGIAFLGGAAYSIACALTYRIILSEEALEIVEPLRRRQMRRDEVSGRRLISGGNGVTLLVLEPKDSRAKKLKVALFFKFDAAFERWCAGVPDLDAEDAKASEVELSNTLYLHLAPEERARHVARLRFVARAINIGVLALAIPAMFLADPDHLLFVGMLFLPWVGVGLVARFQPLYRFGARRSEALCDFTAPLVMPGFALTMQVLRGIHTLEWEGPLAFALAGGMALAAAAAWVDPTLRRQGWNVVLLGVLACAYGYGAGLGLNTFADRSVAQSYPVKVLAKRVSRGSKSTTWYLRLEPWGPVSRSEEVGVPVARYRATQPGDCVCVQLKAGALGVAWYWVGGCPEI